VGPNGGTGIGGYKMIGSDAFIGYLSNSSTGYVATVCFTLSLFVSHSLFLFYFRVIYSFAQFFD
jgi:hypothetical protein